MKTIHYWVDNLPTYGRIYSIQVMNGSYGTVTRFTNLDEAEIFLSKFTTKPCQFKVAPQAVEVSFKVPNLEHPPKIIYNPFLVED